jgi:hypothetical protein
VAFKKNVAKDYLNKNCDINIKDIPFVIKQITIRKEVNINEKNLLSSRIWDREFMEGKFDLNSETH